MREATQKRVPAVGAQQLIHSISLRDWSAVMHYDEAARRFADGVRYWRDEEAYPKVELGFERVLKALTPEALGLDPDGALGREITESITITKWSVMKSLEKVCAGATFMGRSGNDKERKDINNKLWQMSNEIIEPFSSFLSKRAEDIKNEMLLGRYELVAFAINDIVANENIGTKVIMERLNAASNDIIQSILLRLEKA